MCQMYHMTARTLVAQFVAPAKPKRSLIMHCYCDTGTLCITRFVTDSKKQSMNAQAPRMLQQVHGKDPV